jgi:hypothetical protein
MMGKTLDILESTEIDCKTEVQIGPVDRRGHRTQNSISYVYEGVILRFMMIFSALYPLTIVSIGTYKFQINVNTYGYIHLMESFDWLVKDDLSIELIKQTITLKSDLVSIKLITKLWEHQEKSVKNNR